MYLVYLGAYTHTLTYIHAHMYIHIYIHQHTCTYMYTYTKMFISRFSYMYRPLYINIHLVNICKHMKYVHM